MGFVLSQWISWKTLDLPMHLASCLIHKWNKPYLSSFPSHRAPPHFWLYSFPMLLRVGGWVGPGGWLHNNNTYHCILCISVQYNTTNISTLCLKNCHLFIFWKTLSKIKPILMIFGIWNPEKFFTSTAYRYPVSPVSCSHSTLGNPKSSFSTILFPCNTLYSGWSLKNEC